MENLTCGLSLITIYQQMKHSPCKRPNRYHHPQHNPPTHLCLMYITVISCQSKYNITPLGSLRDFLVRHKCYGRAGGDALMCYTVLTAQTTQGNYSEPFNRKPNSEMSCSPGWLCFSSADPCGPLEEASVSSVQT